VENWGDLSFYLKLSVFVKGNQFNITEQCWGGWIYSIFPWDLFLVTKMNSITVESPERRDICSIQRS